MIVRNGNGMNEKNAKREESCHSINQKNIKIRGWHPPETCSMCSMIDQLDVPFFSQMKSRIWS